MQQAVKVIKATQANVNNTLLNSKIKVAAYCRVSTDNSEQLSSFQSQVEYYKNKIASKPEWVLAEIYSDEAVTGTKYACREGFIKMIEDRIAGKIDIIMTKSISRFARNTVDTLNYVRKLKAINVAVYFEEENINTLTMDGELLLTILSSVAQQEVQNTSEHVKKGLKMKLQRGEMVGFNKCLGYDYDPKTKQISINKEEAKIVRFIFEKYAQGIGASSIAKELLRLNIKTSRGHDRWSDTTIVGIIRNEKYYGDCIFGKTYTIDPIEKKRVKNTGQSDMFFMENHHEAIISKELWDKANEYLKKRSDTRKKLIDGPFLDFAGKYTFSRKIHCGFCGQTFTRRNHIQTTTTKKRTWKCYSSTREGIKACADSKSIDEVLIEEAFVNMMQYLMKNETNMVDKFISNTRALLEKNVPLKSVETLKKMIRDLELKQNKLVDLMLEGTLTKEKYQQKNEEMSNKIEQLKKELKDYGEIEDKQKNLELKLSSMRDLLSQNIEMNEFDADVFEALIKNVVVGGYDLGNVKQPYMITFVFSSNRKSLNTDMEFAVLDSFLMKTNFYAFEKNRFGERTKVLIDNIPIRIAIENE